ncbi:hypothetical protein D3C86_1857000 [compost metagenome]
MVRLKHEAGKVARHIGARSGMRFEQRDEGPHRRLIGPILATEPVFDGFVPKLERVAPDHHQGPTTCKICREAGDRIDG